MSSFFRTVPERDGDAALAVVPPPPNPWRVALGVLAGVLVVGGAIAAAVGLRTVAGFSDTVLGEAAAFDAGVATAIVGGAAIVLGVFVGACWLISGALRWDARA